MNCDTVQTAESPVRVRSLIDQVIDGKKIRPGYVLWCSTDEARDAILKGRGALDKQQSEPPAMFAELLRERLSDLDRMGPPIPDKAFARLEEKALSGGARRAFVDDAVLNWLDGAQAAREAVSARFAWPDLSISSLIAQLQSCLEAELKRSEEREGPRRLTDEEMRNERLVGPLRVRRVRGNLFDSGGLVRSHRYVCLEEPWFAFHSVLKDAKELHNSLLLRALQESRALAISADQSALSLIPAAAWQGKHPAARNGINLSFLISFDMPLKWSLSNAQLEAKATRKIIDIRNHFRGQGKRISKDQAVEFVMDRFGLKRDAAEKAWTKSNKDIGEESGRISDETKVSDIAIKQIE